MDTGNALRFYIKANAGIGAGNRISTTITAINGQAVNESLATSGNNLFEEQARFFTSEDLRTGFTVEGTIKLTFTGSAPPQGSRLNLMVNAGNIACETQANAQLYFIHTDHLNTPRLITNTVGLPVWRWDNDDPYGNNAPNENPAGAGQFTCNLRLPGQYFDAELNTHYNYFRDYDPATGRYVQSDPIGLIGGINTYSYVNSNPLGFTDPTGEAGPAGPIVGISTIFAAASFGYSLWRCNQLEKKYEKLQVECERQCPIPMNPMGQPDPAKQLQLYGTINMSVPINKCIGDKDPDILLDRVKCQVGLFRFAFRSIAR